MHGVTKTLGHPCTNPFRFHIGKQNTGKSAFSRLQVPPVGSPDSRLSLQRSGGSRSAPLWPDGVSTNSEICSLSMLNIWKQ